MYLVPVQDLEGEKYISLETYKKDSSPVKTPVWFVLRDGFVFVVTREGTGKVKRLGSNQNVKIAKCTSRGSITGEWHSGTATKVSDEESKSIIKLRNRKYGFMTKIAKFASMGKGNFIAYSIKLE